MSPLNRSLLTSFFVLAFTSVESAEPRYPADTVVAKRGDAVVTMLDLDAAMLSVPPRLRANVMNNPKRIEEFIDRLLITRQVAIEGHASKLDVSPEFRQSVVQQEERLLMEQRLIEFRADLDIGNVELLALERYNVNPGAYAQPGSTSVRHILITSENRSDEEARKIAEVVQAKAAKGDDFIALVNEYSEDDSKVSNEGLITAADSDAMAPAFAAAVKKLTRTGEVSPVVKTEFGYHVIVLVLRLAPEQRTFEQVKERVVSELDNSTRDARVKEYVDQLKNLPIDASPDVIVSLRTRYLPENAKTSLAKPKAEK